MIRLRQRDLAVFSRGLADLYADADPGTLAQRILACLLNVFACEFASFSLLDRRRGRLQTSALSPGVSDWPGMAVHQRYLRHDPAAMHIVRTGDQNAVKVSDFVSLRQYRDLSIYTEVFRSVGCDRRLGFAIQKDAPVSLVATLNRCGKDFPEEDRRLLNALRPHLLQANELALTKQRAQITRERERENLANRFRVGLAEIDGTGGLLWLTRHAQALFEKFFPGKGHARAGAQLPEQVKAQIAPVLLRGLVTPLDDMPPLAPLAWKFDGPDRRRLKVSLTPGTDPGCWQLLLEEAGAPSPQSLARALRLTQREAEILYWLMQGKTNWELGAILDITEKTASRHLENIYAKLHVENRTTAVRVAFEAGTSF